MDIKKEMSENELTIRLKGRLETSTAPELEEVIHNETDKVSALIINMKDVQYVSSAGLRVLLAAEKKMKAKDGKMVVCDIPSGVMNVLKITGFDKILTLQ